MTTKKLTITILSLMLSVSTAFSSSVVRAEETAPEEPAPIAEAADEVPAEGETEEPAAEVAEEAAEEESEEVTEDADPAEDVPAEEVPAEEITETEIPEVTEEVTVEAEPVEEETEEEPVEEETEEDQLFVIPEGFKVAESDIRGKQLLIENGVPDGLYNMKESIDYKADELIMLADNIEYAEQTAQIYGGELASYKDGLAVITLAESSLGVVDAVEASISREELPLVEPNYLVYLEPTDFEEEKDFGNFKAGEMLPDALDWEGWIKDVFWNPDPYISTPSDYYYQWFHEQINTYKGWNATMGSSEVLVAVIDEGVNPNHEDLAGRVIVDDVVASGNVARLGVGHGTHVAGIIAASADNGKGGAGVAPNVRILSINIFPEDGGAETDDIIEAVFKAVDYGAQVANMSIGGYGYSYAYEAALQQAHDEGLIMCVAASNDGSNLKAFPAGFSSTITVASTTKNGTKASYSNFGAWIDVAAPGSFIYSPCSTANDPSNSRYQFMSGTSMATPVVTGVVALYLSKDEDHYVAPEEMRKILKASAVKCSSPQMGAGIVNLEKMFSGDKAAPEIKVYDKYGEIITSLTSPVPAGSFFEIDNTDAGDYDVILFTTNGKKPAIKNGDIVTGDVYEPGMTICLDSFEQNASVKVNAAVVNSLGVMGQVKTVTIKTPKPADQALKIKTLTLAQTKAELSYRMGYGDGMWLLADKLINTADAAVSLDSVDHQWFSSDEKVAYVDEDGYVFATGPGTAKITLKILDGSNKKAVCTVTVNQLAEDMELTGFSTIAAGASATYKATVLPAKTKNKKVVFRLAEDVPGITVTEAGKVTVDKSVPAGLKFVVVAEAQDGSGVTNWKVVEVGTKVTSVELIAPELPAGYEMPKVKFDSKGKLSNIELFTKAIDDDDHNGQENYISLDAFITGGNADVTWKSSNTKVAVVDPDGLVTAVGAGTAKITCTANDASKKSASVSVKVSVPVSSLDFDLGENVYWSVGKTLKLASKASFGSAYGKPTNTKLTYWIEEVWYTTGGYEYDKTYAAVTQKLVTVDNNGNLNVKAGISKIADPAMGDLTVVVGACTTDGTNYTAYTEIYVQPAMKYMKLYDTGTWYCYTDGVYLNYVVTDTLASFDVTSSNPNVMGAFVDNYNTYEENFYSNGKYYVAVFLFTYPGKPGTAKITVKALDGSNKSSSVTYKVKD